MRIPISVMTLMTLFCCEKPKEAVERFVFDNKRVSTRANHKYEFDENGRIKTVHTTNLMYSSGATLDSSTYVKQYKYNEKGQVSAIFDSRDSTWQTKLYNEVDSLIADYTVNGRGDTVRLTEIVYTTGKSNRQTVRVLMTKFSEDFEILKERQNRRNYDTLLFINEFIYNGNKHVKSLSFDKDGSLLEEVELIYDNDRKEKTISYAYLGDSKYVKETTLYYVTETGGFDLLTIGTMGDTIGFQKTLWQDPGKITINHMGQFDMQEISYYDRKGQRIGTVLLDLNEKIKTVCSFAYDSKGNVIEESSYEERISNARRP